MNVQTDNNIYLQLMLYGESGLLSANEITISSSTTFNQYSISKNILENTSFINIRIKNNQKNDNTSFIDNLSLIIQ